MPRVQYMLDLSNTSYDDESLEFYNTVEGALNRLSDLVENGYGDMGAAKLWHCREMDFSIKVDVTLDDTIDNAVVVREEEVNG